MPTVNRTIKNLRQQLSRALSADRLKEEKITRFIARVDELELHVREHLGKRVIVPRADGVVVADCVFLRGALARELAQAHRHVAEARTFEARAQHGVLVGREIGVLGEDRHQRFDAAMAGDDHAAARPDDDRRAEPVLAERALAGFEIVLARVARPALELVEQHPAEACWRRRVAVRRGRRGGGRFRARHASRTPRAPSGLPVPIHRQLPRREQAV